MLRVKRFGLLKSLQPHQLYLKSLQDHSLTMFHFTVLEDIDIVWSGPLTAAILCLAVELDPRAEAGGFICL